jgi:hypothetical protein
MDDERRKHRRLSIRLPMEFYPPEPGREAALRTVTRNISTGGVYFEVDLLNGMPLPQVGSVLRLELTVPPGDGHFPYEGRVSSVAQVIRTDPLAPPPAEADGRRIGLAARFREPLKLTFA